MCAGAIEGCVLLCVRDVPAVTLWVDADSCPARVRVLVARAAARLGCVARFVANRPIPLVQSPHCIMVETQPVDQAADRHIIAYARAGDLVVTRDIVLAKAIVDARISVINDRGDVYTEENIRERLSVRNFMYDLRGQGLAPETTSPFGRRDAARFADSLDRETAKLLRLARRREAKTGEEQCDWPSAQVKSQTGRR